VPISPKRKFGIAFRDADVSGSSRKKEQNQPRIKRRVKREPRLIFLVIDSVFNSNMGLKYSKKIVRDLVKNAPPQDKFILLEIRFGGSLKYVTGPEPGGTIMDPYLKKVEKNARKLVKWVPSRNERRSSRINDPNGPVGGSMISYQYGNAGADYISLRMFMDGLKQLKRALKTIDGPKQTFIFTEGFGAYVDGGEYKYNKMMDEMDNYVYDGGSVLKRIWTGGMRPHHLKNYARKLNRSVSAYYEIFFNPGKNIGGDMKMEIKCKRDGVRINAAGHREKEKPYRKMKTPQKKIFAISVVTGLSFNSMLGRVHKVPYRILKRGNADGERQVTLKVNMPEQLKNRQLDMYLLRFDDAYRDVDVDVFPVRVNDSHKFTLQTSKAKRNLYFIFVEPGTTYAIYNQVK